MPHALTLPIIPNTPIRDPASAEGFGALRLRGNRRTGLVENALFDPAAVQCDSAHQNSQASSDVFMEHMRAVADL